MKRNSIILSAFFAICIMVLSFKDAQGQEWLHGRKRGIYSVGLGGASGLGFYNNGLGTRYRGYSGEALSINVSGEYKVHKLVGIGWQTGDHFSIAHRPLLRPNDNYYPWHYYDAWEIPLIFKVNVHILEATKAKVKDKLDVYAGMGVGVGLGLFFGQHNNEFVNNDRRRVFANLHIGPQVGVRYWIGPKAAIFGEFGWGATFANVGVTF